MAYIWIMMGHHRTVWHMTTALGMNQFIASRVPYGSAFFFEYFTEDDTDYVALKYRDDQSETSEIMMDCGKPE